MEPVTPSTVVCVIILSSLLLLMILLDLGYMFASSNPDDCLRAVIRCDLVLLLSVNFLVLIVLLPIRIICSFEPGTPGTGIAADIDDNNNTMSGEMATAAARV